MENIKQQLIDNLYLTRALLSNISRNNEELERKETEYKEVKAKIYKKTRTKIIEEKKARYQCLIRTPEITESKIQALCKDEKETDREIEKIKKEIDGINTLSIHIIEKIIMAVFMVAFAAAGFFMFKWWMNTNYSFWVALLVLPVDCFLLYLVICAFRDVFSDTREERTKEKEKELKIAIDKKKLTSSLKESLEQSLKQSNLELVADIAKLDKEIENLNSEERAKELEFNERKKIELKEIEDSQNNLIKNSSKLYEFLEESSVLDKRDWKNLDLIIYQVETGRADTVKEALQQADLYIRHDEIVNIMQTATVAICSTIKESIGTLSQSINFTLSEIRDDLADINESNRELSGKFNAMIDAQELSNALLQKANVSSAKLAEDIERIRYIKDYDFIK